MIRKILKSKNSLSFAGNLAGAVFQLISFSLLARALSPSQFGQWSLFIAGTALADMFRFGFTRNSIVWALSKAAEPVRQKVLGTNYIITLAASVILIALLTAARYVFSDQLEPSDFSTFFKWFPALAVVTIPFNNALSVLRAEEKFRGLLYIKLINFAGFVISLFVVHKTIGLTLEKACMVYIATNLATSVFVVAKNWDGISCFFRSDRSTRIMLLGFGKYSIGSIIGSNLLKSADTFIIGMSPLGAAAVSQYVVALKFTEVLELPLRTLLATVFPEMVRAHKEKRPKRIAELLNAYTMATSVLFVAIGIAGIAGAKYLVWIVGGYGYAENGITPYLLMVFCLYGCFLPADRYLGVAIDSINQPKYNFLKVLFMALANIAGDLIAVFVFRSLLLVAFSTVLFTWLGIVLGNFYLPAGLRLTFKSLRNTRLIPAVKLVVTH